jgi:hypothetical protein
LDYGRIYVIMTRVNSDSYELNEQI